MINSATSYDAERKYILNSMGTATATSSIASTGTVYSFCSIAQGTGNQARIANNATATEIWGNLSAYADSVADLNNMIRVIIFRFTDAATPVIGDVLQSSTNYVNSFYNIDNYKSGKLKILYDQKKGVGHNGPGPVNFQWDLKGKFAMQWNSASAVPPIIGGIFAVVVSDSTAVSHPYGSGACCIEFDQ
jgi:hypothetical protein